MESMHVAMRSVDYFGMTWLTSPYCRGKFTDLLTRTSIIAGKSLYQIIGILTSHCRCPLPLQPLHHRLLHFADGFAVGFAGDA